MAKRKPTIQDVARLAGVSTATVSAVINGTKIVSPRRTENVREAIEALDYHADQNARSLRTGQTRVVGVIIPDLTNSFYSEIIAAAEEAASAWNESFHQQITTVAQPTREIGQTAMNW